MLNDTHTAVWTDPNFFDERRSPFSRKTGIMSWRFLTPPPLLPRPLLFGLILWTRRVRAEFGFNSKFSLDLLKSLVQSRSASWSFLDFPSTGNLHSQFFVLAIN